MNKHTELNKIWSLMFICSCALTVYLGQAHSEELRSPVLDPDELVQHLRDRYQIDPVLPRRQEEPMPDSAQPVSLLDIIHDSLKNNLDLSIEQLNPSIQETAWQTQRAAFDPNFFINFAVSRSEQPSANPFAGQPGEPRIVTSISESGGFGSQSSGGIGVNRLLSTGGTVQMDISALQTRSNQARGLDPNCNTAIYLRVNQPLLRGFGADVNLAGMEIAKNTLLISEAQLRRKIIDTVAETQIAYWELVYAISDVAIKRHSLALAQDFLDKEIIKENLGAAVPVDVLEATATVSQRRGELIAALALVKDRQDDLRNQIQRNAGQYTDWETQLWPIETPSFENYRPHLEDCVQLAMEYDPNRFVYKMAAENFRIANHVARDSLKPTLDFFADAGLLGLEDDFGSSFSKMVSGDYYDWRAGFQFQLPPLLRAERADVRKAELEWARAMMQIAQYENLLTINVRKAARACSTTAEIVEAAHEEVLARKASLEAGQNAYDAGATTAHDLLDYQNKLALAQTSQIRTVIDHIRAIITLEQLQGTLLYRTGIELEPGRFMN